MFRVSRFLLASIILVIFFISFGNNTIAQEQRRTITIVKIVTQGSKDELFRINTTAPPLNTVVPTPSFQISENSSSQSFDVEASGTYTFIEELSNDQINAGWKLDPINPPTCTTDPDNSTFIMWNPIGSSGVSIQISFGEDEQDEEITCTFTNELVPPTDGNLRIVKNTIGADGSFGFSVSGPQNAGGTIQTNNNTGILTFFNLQTTGGAYTVTETSLPNGWSLAAISCDSGNPGPADLSSRSITVNVQPNQTTTCTFTNKLSDDPALRDITNLFISSRLNNLLSNDPDRNRLQRRLNPANNGAGFAPLSVTGKADNNDRDLTFSVSSRQLRQSTLAKQARKINEAKKNRAGNGTLGLIENTYSDLTIVENRFDVWAEGHLSRYNDDSGGYRRKGDFSILYFGADYALTPNILFGALVQFDWTDEDIQGLNNGFGKAKGDGWMAGPYIDIRLTDNIFFNGRAAWGKSDNDISYFDNILGARAGQFDSDRWLVTGEITGAWIYNGLHIRPSVQLAYGSENQEAFASSNGVIIASNDASVGRVTFGPEFSYKRELQDGTILEPLIAVEGIWNFNGNDTVLTNGFVAGNDSFRVDLEGGLIVHMTNGVNFRLIGDYDGVGNSGFDAYGGQAWLNIPLN